MVQKSGKITVKGLLSQIVILQNQTLNMLAESQLKNNDLLDKLLTLISIESGDNTTEQETDPRQESGSESINNEHESPQESRVRKQDQGTKPEV